jgi:hypothetical protein
VIAITWKKEVKRERFTVFLPPALAREVRARFPGVPISQAVAFLAEKGLRESSLEARMDSLDMVCRAGVLMLADHAAGGDETEARRLVNSFAQLALSRMKKAKGREGGGGREDQSDAGEGRPEG